MVTVLTFFRCMNRSVVSRSNGYLLLSAFSHLLPDIFHDATNLAPSISPLLPKRFFDGKVSFQNLQLDLYCDLGDILVSRIGFLDDEQANKFCKTVQNAGLDIHGAKFVVIDTVEETRFSSSCSWNDAYRATLPSREFNFIFLTPTAFKRNDKLYLLPDPTVLFSSLLLKLQRSGGKMAQDSPIFSQKNFESILISRCKIATDVMFLKGKTQNKGFTGEVTYDMTYCDNAVAKDATFLAEFARYSGVGIKTSQGMGSVWTQKIDFLN